MHLHLTQQEPNIYAGRGKLNHRDAVTVCGLISIQNNKKAPLFLSKNRPLTQHSSSYSDMYTQTLKIQKRQQNRTSYILPTPASLSHTISARQPHDARCPPPLCIPYWCFTINMPRNATEFVPDRHVSLLSRMHTSASYRKAKSKRPSSVGWFPLDPRFSPPCKKIKHSYALQLLFYRMRYLPAALHLLFLTFICSSAVGGAAKRNARGKTRSQNYVFPLGLARDLTHSSSRFAVKRFLF